MVIENVWLLNGQHGARLKSWAGPDVGYGYINNVTFRNFWNANNEYAAFLDSCYFNVSVSPPATRRSFRPASGLSVISHIAEILPPTTTDQRNDMRGVPFTGERDQRAL